MTLRELKTGQSAIIESVGGEGATRQHFLDMGVIPGARVTLIKFAPMGDPMELRIHGYELTLRLSEAEEIGIILSDGNEDKDDNKEAVNRQETGKKEKKNKNAAWSRLHRQRSLLSHSVLFLIP